MTSVIIVILNLFQDANNAVILHPPIRRAGSFQDLNGMLTFFITKKMKKEIKEFLNKPAFIN
jgi:hypothetical protein